MSMEMFLNKTFASFRLLQHKPADSFAIIMYMEEKYPQNPLLPTDPQKKAIRIPPISSLQSLLFSLAERSGIYCRVQALQLYPKLFKDEVSEKIACLKHHIGKCFSALEELLKGHAGTYATGDEVFLADLLLAPQVQAAINRFVLDMSQYPLLSRLNET